MHVLHRPHLPTAITVTLIAAVLAILFTLAIANTLNDHAPAPATMAGPPAASHESAPVPSPSPFTRSPFASVLTAPVAPAWAPPSR